MTYKNDLFNSNILILSFLYAFLNSFVTHLLSMASIAVPVFVLTNYMKACNKRWQNNTLFSEQWISFLRLPWQSITCWVDWNREMWFLIAIAKQIQDIDIASQPIFFRSIGEKPSLPLPVSGGSHQHSHWMSWLVAVSPWPLSLASQGLCFFLSLFLFLFHFLKILFLGLKIHLKYKLILYLNFRLTNIISN